MPQVIYLTQIGKASSILQMFAFLSKMIYAAFELVYHPLDIIVVLHVSFG